MGDPALFLTSLSGERRSHPNHSKSLGSESSSWAMSVRPLVPYLSAPWPPAPLSSLGAELLGKGTHPGIAGWDPFTTEKRPCSSLSPQYRSQNFSEMAPQKVGYVRSFRPWMYSPGVQEDQHVTESVSGDERRGPPLCPWVSCMQRGAVLSPLSPDLPGCAPSRGPGPEYP